MQGIKPFIDTDLKVKYINKLLQCGFHTIDFGSFVSPKAIPQMRDTNDVLKSLDLDNTDTKLLAIVANSRGALEASIHNEIDYLGYPFSISETFQIRNTNATIAESIERVDKINKICKDSGKEMVVYISMGFGNPYGDPWNVDIVGYWVEQLAALDIGIFSLSDTIGVSNPENISYLFKYLIPKYQSIEFGAHLHTTPQTWKEKIEAAYNSGCRRFDGALKGYGGCPMAKDELVGNMPSENIISYLDEIEKPGKIKKDVFLEAMMMTPEIFP